MSKSFHLMNHLLGLFLNPRYCVKINAAAGHRFEIKLKTKNMKIVPLFYNNEIPGATPNIIQNRTVETFSAELFRKKLEFSDIFNQDSPARFMKINTDLLEEEGIFKNDIAVVDPLEEVVNGKIVVARVDNSLMIRRYEKIKSGLMLYGDTKKISPLKIEEGYDQFKILGVVAYVIKNF